MPPVTPGSPGKAELEPHRPQNCRGQKGPNPPPAAPVPPPHLSGSCSRLCPFMCGRGALSCKLCPLPSSHCWALLSTARLHPPSFRYQSALLRPPPPAPSRLPTNPMHPAQHQQSSTECRLPQVQHCCPPPTPRTALLQLYNHSIAQVGKRLQAHQIQPQPSRAALTRTHCSSSCQAGSKTEPQQQQSPPAQEQCE